MRPYPRDLQRIRKYLGRAAFKLTLVGNVASFLSCTCAIGQPASPSTPLMVSVYTALDEPSVENLTAIATRLREHGRDALDRLMAIRSVLEKERETAPTVSQRAALTARLARLEMLIDQTAAQRWSTRSGLYWHTDLDTARTTAQAERRPILSLRIEGNLAGPFENRADLFLASLVYCHQDLTSLLQQRVILHWQADYSHRMFRHATSPLSNDAMAKHQNEQPSVAHYVLTPDGTPVAVLTRCVAPQVLKAWIDGHTPLALDVERNGTVDRQRVAQFHSAQRASRLQQLHELCPPLATTAGEPQKLYLSLLRSGNFPSRILSPPCWKAIMHAVEADCQFDATIEALFSTAAFQAECQRLDIDSVTTLDDARHWLAEQSAISLFGDAFVLDEWLSDESLSLNFELLNARVMQTWFD